MKVLAPLLTTLVLVACGGGGSGDSSAVATGQFTDSPVKGLQYRTASQSGETNAKGEFRYLPGETVTFFVGDITLGAAVGAARVTPFDLAGMAPPTTVPESGRTTVAFDQAINLAIFLQTLDADGNPANGIEIPAPIRTMTTGLALDFKQRRDAFGRTFALRKLVGTGRTAGLWGGVNAIRTPTLAIKAMYAALGITPVMNLLTKTESIDPNSSKVVWRTTLTYDARGNVTQAVSEYDDNGLLVSRSDSRTFDANGNAIHQETDSNGDGVVDEWGDNTFSVDGDPTMGVYRSDFNGDGTVDHLVTFRMTYSADGRLTGQRIERDYNNDALVDEISSETYSYDAKGNQISSEFDSNGDGMVDSRIAYFYFFDANNRMTRYEEDNNGDGIVDSRSTYAYDAAGNGILAESDNNADGVVDTRLSSSFDANGNRTRRVRDGNADGVDDGRAVFTYDADGYLVRTEDDFDADGVIDQQTTLVYLKVAG